jgi:CBS domain-containing protein
MQDAKASDVMSESVHGVSPQMTLLDLESDLSSHRISGAPVVEHGKVIGIVSRSDIERRLSAERTRSAAVATFYYETDLPDPESGPSDATDPTDSALEMLRTLTVRDVMTAEVISVAGATSLIAVAGLMREKRIHRVLVIEDGGLRGIVSSLDIVGLVADLS